VLDFEMTLTLVVNLDRERTRFMRQLVKSGWRRPFSGAGYYQHPDGGVFHHDQYHDGSTWWLRFYTDGEMPDTKGIYA